jgi:hypothetical protein
MQELLAACTEQLQPDGTCLPQQFTHSMNQTCCATLQTGWTGQYYFSLLNEVVKADHESGDNLADIDAYQREPSGTVMVG